MYPVETNGSIEYTVVLARKNEERHIIDCVNTAFNNSDIEEILKSTAVDLFVGVMPSQGYFSRTIKLPPVEPERTPELMRFEAAQQIPFDIEDVAWGWKMLTDYPNDMNLEIKIAATKKEIIERYFPFKQMGFITSTAEAIPSLYQNPKDERLEAIIAIGDKCTDLIISKNGVSTWNRSMPVGDAEINKLKEEPANGTSITAYEAAIDDLVGEINRTLGFYFSINPGSKIECLISPNKDEELIDELNKRLKLPENRENLIIQYRNPYEKFEGEPDYQSIEEVFAAAGVLGCDNAINLSSKKKSDFSKIYRYPVGAGLVALSYPFSIPGKILNGIGDYLNDAGDKVLGIERKEYPHI